MSFARRWILFATCQSPRENSPFPRMHGWPFSTRPDTCMAARRFYCRVERLLDSIMLVWSRHSCKIISCHEYWEDPRLAPSSVPWLEPERTKNANETSFNSEEQMVSVERRHCEVEIHRSYTDKCCLQLLLAPGHSGTLMINFFRPLHIPLEDNTKKKKKKPGKIIGISEAYHNSAGFLHDLKKTWQVLFPIPLRRMTSVIFDLLTLKTRPNELLMSDSEHFKECLRTNIGDFTFQEAFDRTGRILNITGTPKYFICDVSPRFKGSHFYQFSPSHSHAQQLERSAKVIELSNSTTRSRLECCGRIVLTPRYACRNLLIQSL